MSLMDIAKKFGGGSVQTEGAGLPAMIVQLLSSQLDQRGGISGLVQMFQSKGLGDIASSWVSKGPNLPISGNQVENGLGQDLVQQFAAKAGISPEEAKSQLAEHLPGIVDRLTPDGTIPEGGGLVGSAMDLLKAKFL